ncbi:MAG: hypothetical protein K2Y71_02235 [Xanthobacteraceae bacterium]|nr:hypothetical protein [Xanthobacteraceae bacterium]
MARIEVPISVGELVDKVTILEIKSEKIADAGKRGNIRRELDALTAVLKPVLAATPGITPLKAELRAVNETLWQIEDDIRDCERKRDFGAAFVALARAVYQTNDRRAVTKRKIDELAGSELVEEKSYAPY